MFATPNVHSAASSAMSLAFRNAAQPQPQAQAQALRWHVPAFFAARVGVVWAQLLRPLHR